MAKTKKRVLSLLLALVMALSLLPTVAFATDKDIQAQEQIVNAGGTVYYDKDGNQHTSGTLGEDGIVVEMSKTVEATGTENLFNVTLQVKTTQKLEEIPSSTPDAAVMLVLDVSNSMDDCVNCGKEQSDKAHQGKSETKYYCSGTSGTTYSEHWHKYYGHYGRYDCEYCHKTWREHNPVTTTNSDCVYRSRLADAQAAALDFLNQFANETGATGDDRRMVAVVSFGSNAQQELNWVNIRTQEGMNKAIAAINNVQVGHGHGFGSDYGGTNIEGGLMLAKNILNAGRQNKNQIKDIDYLYTILLTDGNPTYHVEGDPGSTSYITGTRGGGSETEKSDVKDVGDEADAIRGITNLSKLYSICFGTITKKGYEVDVWDTTPFDDWRDTNPSTDEDMTVGDWLRAFSSAAYNGQADGLFESFDSIADQIAMAAQAWRVTDTMGGNILYQKALPVYNAAGNGTIYNAVTMGNDGKSFVWDILSSNRDDNITDIQEDQDGNMISGTLGYTFKYQILLNNVGFTETTTVPTNESAVLKYMVADEHGNWPTDPEALKTGEFAVPQVKGYVADLSFTKVNEKGAALLGAQFTLTPSPADSVNWSDSDTSEGDGKIDITHIPSGYTYTLKETVAPKDYNPVADLTVTVKYGVITTASTASDGANITDGKLVDPAKQTYRDVTITKTWRKPANETTPDSITVTLKQDGKDYKTVTLTPGEDGCSAQGDTWTYTFYNLPDSNPEGGYHVYTVEEAPVDGYTTTYGQDGLNIVNTASGTTSVVVAKFWTLPEGMSPADQSVEVTLTQNGSAMTGAEYTQTITGNGRVKFENLPKYDANGQPYEYGAVEAPGNYQQAKPTTSDGYTITFYNTVAEETTTISGVKTWNDGGDTVDHAPITVTLYKDGEATDRTTTASAETNWEYKFENLPRYEFTKDNGNITAVREIKYTVKETAVDGYKSTVTGNNITNTRTGEVSLTVYKEWVSQGDHPVEVTVQLYANGVASGDPETFTDSHTFAGLAKYDAQGKLIDYSVTESPVEGYTASYSKRTTDSEGNYQITITNTQSGAEDEVKVTVTKTWQQPGDPSDLTATFTLVKNGTPMDGDEYTKTITGNGVATFEGLPRYTETPVEGGDTLLEEITYTVQENVPNGYISTSEQVGPVSNGDVYFHFTNTITDTTSVSVEKTWVKPADVAAPAVTFTVQRSVDGLTWEDAGTIALASGETSGKAENLAKYNDKGQQYIYQVKELSVPGYSSSMTGGMLENGTYSYQVTNTINQAYADIPVSKTWIDGNTPDSERPSVTLDLLQDGIAVASVTFAYDEAAGKVMATVTKDGVTSDPVEASVSGNTWSTTVPDMPLYNAAGTAKYDYTASEAQVPAGYRATATGTNVTNKRSGSIDIDITKYWVDPGDGYRPDITLVLTGSDDSEYRVAVQEMPDNEITATLNGKALTTVVSGSTWTITVPDLPEYTDAGAKITYTLSEEPVEGYTSEAVKDQPFAIQNTIEQVSDVTITPEKVWANMDVDGVYQPVLPESITVALFRDGVKVEGSEQTVAVDEDGSCTFESYENLERYNLTTGQYYHYEVLELDANGSPVKENGTISFGTDNDYTVTYRTFEVDTSYNLHVTITNTFKVPAKYLWMVKTHYVHYDYNGNQIAVYNNQSEIFAEVESTTVRVNPDDYKVCPNDNLTYVYDADNAGNKTEATLLNQNHLYVLELYYELTDNAPYIPPDTPDPPITDPEDPGTEIPEEPTPGGELPEEPEEPEEPTDIPDENVPEGELPEDIPDEDVPQGEAPKTGDNMSMWLALSGTAALGLVALNVFDSKRKKKEHEDQ